MNGSFPCWMKHLGRVFIIMRIILLLCLIVFMVISCSNRERTYRIGLARTRMKYISDVLDSYKDQKNMPTSGEYYDNIITFDYRYLDYYPKTKMLYVKLKDNMYVLNDGFMYQSLRPKCVLRYVSDGENYVLGSCGPDEKYEDHLYEYLNHHMMQEHNNGDITNRLVQYMYDPTNGYSSAGDIIITSYSN